MATEGVATLAYGLTYDTMSAEKEAESGCQTPILEETVSGVTA
jgi:hypothetical protein